MKITIRFALLVACFALVSVKAFSQQHTVKNYEKDFNKVDSLANKAQPEAALTLINTLNSRARAEGNTTMLVKSVIYRMLFQSYLEEDAFSKILADLKQDVNLASQPEKSVLQSLLAETYWKYYQQNRYQIIQRTTAEANIGDDIRTWSIQKITNETVKTFLASVSEIELLQNSKVGVLNTVLLGDTTTRYLRPTLYDLLAHRALDVFMSTQIDISHIDNAIDFSSPHWFTDYKTFFFTQIEQTDSVSFASQALRLFQNLLQFHSGNQNAAALADVDLKRLKFVYQRSGSEEKQEQYLKALQLMAKQVESTEIYADVLYEQAFLHKNGQLESDTNKLNLVKAVEIAYKTIKSYPNSFGAQNAENLIHEIKSKALSIQIKEFILPGKPAQLLFSYKNINTIFLKLYKLPVYDDGHYFNFNNEAEYDSFLKEHKPIKEWLVVLPKASDYQFHTLLDKMDALPGGNYVLIAQNTNDSTQTDAVHNYANFKVTSIAVTNRILDNNKHQYFLANSLSGQPLKNASILEKISDYRGDIRIIRNGAVLKTDENGYAASEEIFNIRNTLITHGNDSLSIQLYNYGRYRYKPESKRVILFTDRPIYRPGQTVYYKGLFIQNAEDKNSILTSQSLELSFKDANSQEIEKALVTTNDYGTFQGSFIIPVGKLNGQMQLSTIYGSISVQVEEYKRPTFEVVFEKSNQKYILNDSVKIQGMALAFAGYPVSGAKVRYTVYRSPFPRYSHANPYQPAKQLAIGKTETKAGGSFTITFFAAADNDVSENYSYQVRAEITDLNGETRVATKSINVGKKDIVLNIDMADQLFLDTKTDSIPFSVLNLNGEPINAKLHTEWYMLQYPGRLVNRSPFSRKPESYALSEEAFFKTFPNEEYAGDGDPANWPVAKVDFNQNIKADNGNGTLNLNSKNLQPGYYKVKFLAINSSSDTITTDKIIRIYNNDVSTIESINEWLVVEKKTITPSESAIFRLAGALSGGKAYYEVYYKGKVTDKVWITTSPEQSIIKIKPKPSFEDAFAVQFTMVQNGVIYNSMQQISIIDASKQLDIKFLTFRNKLQPGEKESWRLRISNKAGEKQMAELAATLYDASLDDLKKMDWDKITSQAYNYNFYTWNFKLNNLLRGNELWFLRNYERYFALNTRKYEQLNFSGFNYYGGYNNGYHNYLRRQEMVLKKDLSEQAIKKLAELQNGSILYGIVTDEAGYGLSGVSIRSGKIASTTDEYGIYKINVKLGDQLQFSFIGHNTFTAMVGKAKRLNITLQYDGRGLNEVVVVGNSTLSGSQIRIRGNSGVEYGKVSGIPIVESLLQGAVITEDNSVRNFESIEVYDPITNTYIINGRQVPGPARFILRSNFSETAFFYPQLQTNEAGEIYIDFTIPQSLTRYKMMGFAHTKDLKMATISRELVTQKQLAISANAPRFFREADTILFSAKLNNLSGASLKGDAILELRNALTGKIIQIFSPEGKATQNFEIANNGNEVLKWPLIIPSGINAISYKVLAQSGKYSDGEEMTIPVLPNAMLVTETMSLNVRGNTSKTFTMDKLLQSASSKTLRNQGLTLEFTSNPVWYAVQALPYLMEYPYECAEQTFSRFYANSFALGIINSSPKIKQVFSQWQQTNNGEALLSNLEKNPELKSILLEETPWVRAADNETERKKRLAVLFDLNRMTYELKSNFEKLEKMQNANGSFPWFTGMNEDQYITQHIVLGMGQLKRLKLIDEKTYPGFNKMLNKSINYLDDKLMYDYSKEVSGKSFAYLPLHYLYARSYTNQINNDPNFNKAVSYYLKKAADTWKTMEPYQQGQAALILHRNGNKAEALRIVNLLKERAQQSDEVGMYWANNRNGWWWYQNPIETQSLLIEVFDEVASDVKSVEEMKIWLLKNKQTNDWKTTKATAAACYALLMRGYNLLEESAEPEILIGSKTLSEMGIEDTGKEAGTGYQKISIPRTDVKPEMGTIEIKNNNKTIAWGGLNWQYFEQLDKITAAETGVKIKKQLFLQKQTDKGDLLTPLTTTNVLTPGDLLKVRIEIYADRDMEYVHLKDMRSSGFEPVNVISQYKYQDGLGYYESTKDASANFFISYLRKGVYVFEYALRVSHAGNFSNGITSLQCMYAPEFTTHSDGIRVKVKP